MRLLFLIFSLKHSSFQHFFLLKTFRRVSCTLRQKFRFDSKNISSKIHNFPEWKILLETKSNNTKIEFNYLRLLGKYLKVLRVPEGL